MRKSNFHTWMILIGLTLGVCVTNGFARFAYGLILPAMKAQLGWTYAQAGWLNTANAMGYVIGSMATLVLIRRVSSGRLFSVAMVGTSVFLLATGLTDQFVAQTTWRILTGIFGATAFITGAALSATLFADHPRRNALAIAFYFGIGGGLGMVLSGAILPAMFDVFVGRIWPLAWIIMGVASLIFCPLCVWASESLRPPVKQQIAHQPLPVFAMLPEILSYLCFGIGYIVYVTFIVALMGERAAGPALVSAVWVVMGLGIMASPFVWRTVFARYATGMPLAQIMAVMAGATFLAVLWHTTAGLIVSAALFGVTVFMAPGAVANFSRKNLPQSSWGAGVGMFTILFSVGQTVGPVAAGFLGDMLGDIGFSVLAAAGILLLGSVIALAQKALKQRPENSAVVGDN